MNLTPQTVEVYAAHGTANVLIGRAWFEPTRAGTPTTFACNPSYLENSAAYAIDPGLPLDAGPHHVLGLFGALGDSAPDRWGRRLIQRAQQQAGSRQTLGDADYLLAVNDELRQGNLRFRAPDSDGWLTTGGRVPSSLKWSPRRRPAIFDDSGYESPFPSHSTTPTTTFATTVSSDRMAGGWPLRSTSIPIRLQLRLGRQPSPDRPKPTRSTP